MVAKQKILIVDSEPSSADWTSLSLTDARFDTMVVHSGEEALQAFETYAPNLILLEVVLPDMDGCQVCREIRKQSNVPIIMLTVKYHVADRVLGLELGADDYITKPYEVAEMIARVKAVLRRSEPRGPIAAPDDKQEVVSYPGLEINLTNYSVLVDSVPVDMPPKELELLYFLASSPNQVFTREQLLDRIWGFEYVGETRTVDVHIKRLRKKIKTHGAWSLATVWGVGYKFEMMDLK